MNKKHQLVKKKLGPALCFLPYSLVVVEINRVQIRQACAADVFLVCSLQQKLTAKRFVVKNKYTAECEQFSGSIFSSFGSTVYVLGFVARESRLLADIETFI